MGNEVLSNVYTRPLAFCSVLFRLLPTKLLGMCYHAAKHSTNLFACFKNLLLQRECRLINLQISKTEYSLAHGLAPFKCH